MKDCPSCSNAGNKNTAESFSVIYARGRSFASTTYEAETSRQLVGDTLYVTTELRNGAVEILTPAAKRHKPPSRFSLLIVMIIVLLIATTLLYIFKLENFFRSDTFLEVFTIDVMKKLGHLDQYYYGMMLFIISAFSTVYLLPISFKNDAIKLWESSYRCKNCDLAFQVIPSNIKLWSWGNPNSKSFFAKIYWYFGCFVFCNLIFVFIAMNFISVNIKLIIIFTIATLISGLVWKKYFKAGLMKLFVIFAITLFILLSVIAV